MTEKGKVIIDLHKILGNINPNIYGHFADLYGAYPGIWVGEDLDIPNYGGIRKDLVEAFRKINPPVIRWPGGTFADYYHWRDGMGSRDKRPRRVDPFGREESNQFGTDEFMRFCSLVGAEPYICLNVGSGTPEEARSWVEYCNYGGDSFYAKLRAENGHPEPYNVRYWEIGNETYTFTDPHAYAVEYRRMATLISTKLYEQFYPNPSLLKSKSKIEFVACGQTREWNMKFMEAMKDYLGTIDYISIHHYFGGYGGAINFTDKDYYELLASVQGLEYYIQETLNVIDFFAEQKKDIRIIVDEWGTWYPEATLANKFKQQNTLRDAILAASVLNLFNRYSKRVVMANIALLINVLQALFLTDGDKLIATPTYYVYDIYKYHMGNNAVRAEASSSIIKGAPAPAELHLAVPLQARRPLEALDVSASVSKNVDELVITLVNNSLDEEYETEILLRGDQKMADGKMITLTADNVRTFNDFSTPEKIKLVEKKLTANGKTLNLNILPHSVNTIIVKLV
jgi:alpha-N-arabinofuranosidase